MKIFVPFDGIILGPSGGSKLTFACLANQGFVDTKSITLNNDTAIEPGKLYRLNVDFTKP